MKVKFDTKFIKNENFDLYWNSKTVTLLFKLRNATYRIAISLGK